MGSRLEREVRLVHADDPLARSTTVAAHRVQRWARSRATTLAAASLLLFSLVACGSSLPATIGEPLPNPITDPAEGPPPTPREPGAGGDDGAEQPDPPADRPVEPAPARLTYAPPALSHPVTIRVDPTSGPFSISMETNRDYLIVMPEQPVRRAMALIGGRNVVMIGGEIFIPHQGSNPTINARRALYIANATGIVHIEGVLMHGDDISEGVQTRAPGAIVQLQNVGIFNVHARDQRTFSDNHPDIIQTWGGVRELRVDRLTGDTDYQGLFFKADYNGPHGPVHLHNVNVRGMPTARYLLWASDTGGGYPIMTLDNVWVEAHPNRAGGLGTSVWPDVHGTSPYRAVISTGSDGVERASWPGTRFSGDVRDGRPPGGDFVTKDAIGIGYTSPGYR
jgi:hypothetical protein